ncbi:hypothetical protein [Azospirillum soli]|uniref:hypothetical protein n=1 Tax=Azospirillum soli TaxID=1304799 RepID=UPI001AE51516|nr:hypothetical protein [Azospirillum soli]MBP2315519.1 CheY-like chemotaxis protein [Azospirillum soli]
MDIQNTRILLINANDALRASDRDVLQAAGFSTVIEGKEPPVEGVVAAGAWGQWDLLIVEWRPDGLEMVQALRAEEGTRHKPVIGITSDPSPELAVEALRVAGANGWIVRPISDPVRRVQTAIERAAAKAAEVA